VDSITCVNSIFEQPWYIDAVAPGKSQTFVFEKGANTLARLTVVSGRRFWRRVLTKPPFTQTCGAWFSDQGGKQTTRLETQKNAINAIIDQIPKRICVDLYLDHNCQYVLPWMWRGFRVTPFFSYRIEDLRDEKACWDNLRYNIRNNIRQAQKVVQVRTDMPLETLFAMQDKTFARQNRKFRFDVAGFRRLDAALRAHDACRLMCAVDQENRVHAAAYFVYDEHSCYYLAGGGDPELRTSGAASLLIWEGIRFAATVSQSFDFEGSIIDEIERFFRAFGGTPQVYYRVTRFCPLLRFAEWVKPTVKKMLKYR
jgi:hypothetical protein